MRSNQDTQGTVNEQFTTNVQEFTNTGNIDYDTLTTDLFREFNQMEDMEGIDFFDLQNDFSDVQEGGEIIRVLLWNATGLTRNLDPLITRLKAEDAHFAIAVETWFHPDRHIPDICVMNSVGQAVTNLNRGVNGVSIVLNPNYVDNVHMKNIICLAKDTVNGCFLVVQVAGIKIAGIYNAPSHPLDIDVLLDEIAAAGRMSPNDPLIIAGDFNARRVEWLDTCNTAAGTKLKEWTVNWGLERKSTGPVPTCTTSRGNSIVDHIFTNLPEPTASVARRPVPLADHAPIVFEFSARAFTYPADDRSYMRIKKERLRDKDVRIQYGLECLRKHDTLERCLDQLEASISAANSLNQKQQALDLADKTFCDFFVDIGKRILGEVRAGKKKIEYKPLFSVALEELYESQEREPTAAKAQLIANEICRLKRIRFEEFSEKLCRKPPMDVMKVVAQIQHSRRTRGSALKDSAEALADYARYFGEMTTNTLPVPGGRPAPVCLEVDDVQGASLSESIFTSAKIIGILIDVPWNKAAGKSGVCYDLIKAADFITITAITRWFRLIFKTGLVPASWTRSLIVPVPKKGDLNVINNYRPISLTESFRKIFEHCLTRYLTMVAGPMHFSQGGFRADHCCTDMIVSLNEVMRKNKNMHVAFLDIKAAYDSVDRIILWNRCRERGFSDEVIRILQRLFDHNSAQVIVNGRRSQPFGIKAGLLQGSVLSPFLYSIFIDNLAEELMRHPTITVGTCKLNCTMYADDIAVFARSAQVLQLLLLHCSRHANQNRYRFNVQKCAVIGDASYNYKLDNVTIPKVDTFVYLGVEIGRNGIKYDEFIKRRCKNAVDAGMKLVGLGMNLGGFTPPVASMLYKVFIRSKLEAGSCILPESKRLTKLLEAAQRKILARFFFCGQSSSGTILRSLMNAPTMSFRQRFLRSRYVHRCKGLENTHIVNTIMDSARNYLLKLEKGIFPKDECEGQGQERLKRAEMVEVHAATAASTRGYLIIPATGKVPWFLRSRLDPMLRKRICHWLLKKYPAAAPSTCGRCHTARCTQAHIADCCRLLENNLELIPARFRPENLLSNPESCLETIGKAIHFAVGRCLPQLRLL